VILIAQAETTAKLVNDMANATDVRPFLGAAFLLAAGLACFFFAKWQGSETKRDADREAELARANKAIARLTGAPKEETGG
jgi:hypothetical protein